MKSFIKIFAKSTLEFLPFIKNCTFEKSNNEK